MSIVTELLSTAQEGKLVENLSQRFGLSPDQTKAVIDALTPALGLGLQNAASNPQVLEHVVGGMTQPTHAAAFVDPAVAHGDEAGALGANAATHLFGSDAAAGEIVQIASRASGVGPDIIAKLLPVLASVVLGGLFKKFESQGLAGMLIKLAGAGGLGAVLSQMGGAGASAQTAPGNVGQAGGGLGGLLGALLGGGQGGGALGGILGSILGGGGMPQAQAPGGQTPAPGGMGGGLEDVLGQLIKTLNSAAPAGAPAGVPAGHTAELQDVLNRVFPTK